MSFAFPLPIFTVFRRLLLAGLLLAFPLHAAEKDDNGQVTLSFFWSLTCPHCTAAHPHVEALSQERPWLTVEMLELSRQPANAARFRELIERSGTGDQAGVPAFLFCGELHFGWESDATTGALLRQRLDACHARQFADGAMDTPPPTATPTEPIHIPLIGAVDPMTLSLPVLTVIIAGLDAFNPCAFFVLLFLLSMMAHQKNRGRMLVIGGIFVAISGLMYFAFMAAWLNVFHLFGHLAGVTWLAGSVALLVGMLNVKDFLLFGRGPSLSMSAGRKDDLFRRTRAILAANALPTMLVATIALAVAANFYELLCTAGFPMVYTRVLTLAELSPAARYGYLALYNLIYMLPLAAIVAIFVRTLGAHKLAEREGRLLKLLSGLTMSGLGMLLLAAPETLGQPLAAFALMAAAVGITWVAAKFVGKT